MGFPACATESPVLVHDRVRPVLRHRLTDRHRIQPVHHEPSRPAVPARPAGRTRRRRRTSWPRPLAAAQPPPQDPVPPPTNTRMPISFLIPGADSQPRDETAPPICDMAGRQLEASRTCDRGCASPGNRLSGKDRLDPAQFSTGPLGRRIARRVHKTCPSTAPASGWRAASSGRPDHAHHRRITDLIDNSLIEGVGERLSALTGLWDLFRSYNSMCEEKTAGWARATSGQTSRPRPA